LFAEVLAQILFMFFGIVLIHRIITYVPTYSGEKYHALSAIGPVIPMLVILISLQTKLGEKVSILFERVMELWNGQKDTKGKTGNGKVKVSQPISQPMSQSMGSTSISSLPPIDATPVQQLPNYDQMYQQNSTPLVGAATPGMETFEPMAANSMSGGFGGAFNW